MGQYQVVAMTVVAGGGHVDPAQRRLAMDAGFVDLDGALELDIVLLGQVEVGVADAAAGHLHDDFARSRGLDRMEGEVLTANHRMLDLVRSMDFQIERSQDNPGVQYVWKDL